MKNSKVLTDVPVVRIAEFIRDVVGTRQISEDKKGAVIMKLDVEVTVIKLIFCYDENCLLFRAKRWRLSLI